MLIKAKQGDREAMEEIMKRYTPFVIKTARSIYVKGYAIEDLVQEGQASIIKAVNMYDTERGNAFTTYVFNTIKRTLYLLIRAGVKEANCCSLHSLNKEGCEFIDVLVSTENIEEDTVKKEEKTMLSKALKKLDEGEKEIIYWYYLENKTLNEYANFKEVCYRTAIARKKKSLLKLKKYLEEMNYHGII
ncbi:sigma-70 family RNA polymerase sigma factor [Clostridium sp. OS1-26]|uniref:sigma-70 family RNA polymerase sigma factor n=1 Tax=Clostridium sp. OS1-26 TaxID=3070681 RepID=UPI0027E11288|nr:sigma-70 family RNA polymerase sigma factor [Clostridium sp. OS1-26]WML33457.1 sigma-70 family RNA polymerase sigma factor [Clostridium sp. OS1-26]